MTSHADSGLDVIDDMRIPVRDGIALSARVWMPKAQNAVPLPAILEILPYRKRDGTAARDATTHAHFAAHGYFCLRVDLRGTGESDGLLDDEYSEQELSDIEDTITWIAAQPWCTGAVGIMGISWGGFNGLQVAARQPKALKAVITLCSSVDRYADDIHYKGGCQLTENVGWAATAMSWFSMPPDPMLVGDRWRDIWLERLANAPFLISDWIRHAERDDYWTHGSVCEDFSQIEAPVLSIGGWHDGYRNTPVKLLEGQTSGPVKAIVGPWNHKYPHLAAPAPRIDFVTEALRWWDRWLKDIPNGAEDDPDYRVYVMDGVAPRTSYDHRPGKWLGIPDWPTTLVDHQDLVLGDGTLGASGISDAVTVDTNPICGAGFGEYFPFGFGPGELPDDQRQDDALSACFETAALKAPMTVLGAPQLRLSISADQPFGQMAVRLCDVAPNGASTLITYGLLNLRFRDGFDRGKDLVPGETYEVSLDLDQAAYVVPEGHKLRLAISPSYWPFVWPVPGAVTLSIKQGTINVPHMTDHGGPEWHPNAENTQSAQSTKTIRTGKESKTLECDHGQNILTIQADHGEVEILDHGLRVASALEEHWSIDHDDITSPRAKIRWERSIERGEFAVSSHLEMNMHCDEGRFFVDAWIRAFEGDECVFEKRYEDAIQREIVSKQTINREENT